MNNFVKVAIVLWVIGNIWYALMYREASGVALYTDVVLRSSEYMSYKEYGGVVREDNQQTNFLYSFPPAFCAGERSGVEFVKGLLNCCVLKRVLTKDEDLPMKYRFAQSFFAKILFFHQHAYRFIKGYDVTPIKHMAFVTTRDIYNDLHLRKIIEDSISGGCSPLHEKLIRPKVCEDVAGVDTVFSLYVRDDKGDLQLLKQYHVGGN